MKGPTGFRDDNGREIHYGDLLKCFHFVHYRRRRKCYLYFVVIAVDGVPCVREPHKTSGHQCTLSAVGSGVQIIHDDGHESPDAWFDRPTLASTKGGA